MPGTKRKRSTETKIYAVKVGFRPGIYDTWDECLNQVRGFKGALFQSFTTIEEAQAFIDGIPSTRVQADAKRFYAIQRGKRPGVYTDWPTAQAQITGFRQAKYKRFSSLAEAEVFVNQGDQNAVDALAGVDSLNPSIIEAKSEIPTSIAGSADAFVTLPDNEDDELGITPLPDNTVDGFDPTIFYNPEMGKIQRRTEEQTVSLKLQPKGLSTDGVLRIFTDGSSKRNGRCGAAAGVGVYFGDCDPRNVSEPLKGPRQTNQRAELTAVLRALEIAPRNRDVKIFSDSKYAINCVTEWFINWRKNNWMTTTQKAVENRDLIEKILTRIEKRAELHAKTNFEWVKGHANEYGNVMADQLAVAGATKSSE